MLPVTESTIRLFVALSGLTALLHARARSRTGLAVFGAASGLTALAVVFFGVQIG